MAYSRFSRNLGDDVIAQSDYIIGDDGDAYANIKLPNDENLLPNRIFGDQHISGAGEVTSEECGTFKSAYINALKHLRAKRFGCHKQGCPKCFRTWARRQATSAAGYLWAFAEQYHRRLAHWSLSPSQQTLDGIIPNGKERERANEVWRILDQKLRAIIDRFSDFNERVVSVVRHPSRKHCPKCGSKMKDKMSFCIACNSPAEWYWSPHLHVITDFRYAYEQTSEFINVEREMGIIFSEDSVPPTKDELENVISYELGHALYIPGESHQAIRYLGFSAKTHFRSEITKQKEAESEDDPVDPNLKHIFYRVAPYTCDEIQPGVLKIRRYNGQFQFDKDYKGDKIPLWRTRYVVRLQELGRWLKGRWTRTTPARKLPKQKDSREVWDTIGWEKRFLNI